MLNDIVNHAYNFLLPHINRLNGSAIYFVILNPSCSVFES